MSDKIVTVTATNASDRLLVLNSLPRLTVEPGETVKDVKISEAELEAAKHFGLFSFKGGASSDEGEKLPSLTNKNKADLLEIAKAEKAEVNDDMTNAEIVTAIEAKRKG